MRQRKAPREGGAVRQKLKSYVPNVPPATGGWDPEKTAGITALQKCRDFRPTFERTAALRAHKDDPLPAIPLQGGRQ
jgi:hypothetical protein